MMLRKFDPHLANYLLTQASVTRDMPFDVIDTAIKEAIEFVKKNLINAKITNVIFNINDQLVPAQIYVERKNAFVPTSNTQFGTSPTAYKIQVRFPFGLSTRLGQEEIFLPSGEFTDILQPYSVGTHILDDVQRDYKPSDIITTEKVTYNLKEEKKAEQQTSEISLSIADQESLQFTCRNEIGKGYTVTPGGKALEYYLLSDYQQRLKMAGVYPLFYADGAHRIIKLHRDYPGFTADQDSGHAIESTSYIRETQTRLTSVESQQLIQQRQHDYNQYINKLNQTILASKVGERWAQDWQKSQNQYYVFDIMIINGIALYSQSGLPVNPRLRDYQLELFYQCDHFLENLRPTATAAERAAIIDMGVGAGKTFFVFTLLQNIKYKIQSQQYRLAPPFCMAPNHNVAAVTQRSVNRQGRLSGMSAMIIDHTTLMPDGQFLEEYANLTTLAASAANEADNYLMHGLQADILAFCREKSLHPFIYLNYAYLHQYGNPLAKFKNSIDTKRLLLIVEGYKTIVKTTGMLKIEALFNILEEFTTIQNTMSKDEYFLAKAVDEGKLEGQFKTINYAADTTVLYHRGDYNYQYQETVNLTQLDGQILSRLLHKRWKNNSRNIRDSLSRMAFLADAQAAVILANSGGLGNTYSNAELKAQIAAFLPIAARHFNSLINKPKHNHRDHYTLYLYLKEIFIIVPDELNINKQDPNYPLESESLSFHVQLISHIKDKMTAKINQLAEPIKRAQQLAGIASLAIGSKTSRDNTKLALTHVPIFTPEGLARYFEHLDSLVGQPQVNFIEQNDVYALQRKGRFSAKDIGDKLEEFLNSPMIADEVHKQEFAFLYDRHDPIHQRIHRIVKKYLQKDFIDILPPRIGMSGTINQIALKAFTSRKLYTLSIPTMIQQGLVKEIDITTQELEASTEHLKQSYAKQVVVDYFSQSTVLFENKEDKNPPGDLFALSKGLIFSKEPDKELNDYLVHFFNLLIEEKPGENDLSTQQELFAAINQNRAQKLDSSSLRGIQRAAFQNNVFALYLEYLLSKSDTPKEFSDIIGLQNNLFAKGFSLRVGIETEKSIIASLEKIDLKTITEADCKDFIAARIKHSALQAILTAHILRYKNDYRQFFQNLCQATDSLALNHWLTTHRDDFESGQALVLLATPAEQTGYSHEPVGIIVDMPAPQEALVAVNQAIARLKANQLSADEMRAFLNHLKILAQHSFSYDEKTQVGGRALRTPHGKVKYIQYQSTIKRWLEEEKISHEDPLSVFKIETRFDDIFTADNLLAEQERASINFNRAALSLLRTENNFSLLEFSQAVAHYFAAEIEHQPALQISYQTYLKQRLPLLWALQHQPQQAKEYLHARHHAQLVQLVLMDSPQLNNQALEEFLQKPWQPKPAAAPATTTRHLSSQGHSIALAAGFIVGVGLLVTGMSLIWALILPWVAISLAIAGALTLLGTNIYAWLSYNQKQLVQNQAPDASLAIPLPATSPAMQQAPTAFNKTQSSALVANSTFSPQQVLATSDRQNSAHSTSLKL